MKQVAIFNPPRAGEAWRAWKTANAEALRRVPEDAIRVDIGRHLSGGTYIAVLVADEWVGALAAERER
jgi:hypothetical protein